MPFVILGTFGDYDDKEVWAVRCCATESDAAYYVKHLNDVVTAFFQDYVNSGYAFPRDGLMIMRAIDKKFRYTPFAVSSYYYEEVL